MQLKLLLEISVSKVIRSLADLVSQKRALVLKCSRLAYGAVLDSHEDMKGMGWHDFSGI